MATPATPPSHIPADAARRSGTVDNAVYVDGARVGGPTSLDQTYETLQARKGMASIGLFGLVLYLLYLLFRRRHWL